MENKKDDVLSTASFFDKMDWRRNIQFHLDNAIKDRHTNHYPEAVNALYDCVAAEYPGFSAKKALAQARKRLEEKYTHVEKLWLEQNPTKRRAQKYLYHGHLKQEMCYDLFSFIINLIASKRMLLLGVKSVETGQQIEYEEPTEDKE